MDNTTVGCISQGSRKRVNKNSARDESKKKKVFILCFVHLGASKLFFFFVRYANKDIHLEKFNRPCTHNTKRFSCMQVSLNDIKNARNKLYKTANKLEQDQRLCLYISAIDVQRKRKRRYIASTSKPRSFSTIYYVKPIIIFILLYIKPKYFCSFGQVMELRQFAGNSYVLLYMSQSFV